MARVDGEQAQIRKGSKENLVAAVQMAHAPNPNGKSKMALDGDVILTGRATRDKQDASENLQRDRLAGKPPE